MHETAHIEMLHANSPLSTFMEIASLHKHAIKYGLLELLPLEALARIFQTFTKVRNTGLWIARDWEGRVTGFVAGCASTRSAYFQAILCGGLPMLLSLLRAAFSTTVRRRLLAVILYPFKLRPTKSAVTGSPVISGAELIAIAIMPALQSRGIGRQLVASLEHTAIAQWHASSLWVSTNAADPRSNAFYQKIGFLPAFTKPHQQLTLQVFSKHLSGV